MRATSSRHQASFVTATAASTSDAVSARHSAASA
jgi:hypothetical protein